ncbi:MAG TPA: hypothetical protein VG992_03430 [Candidatus Saccharimonadales bacterium]|nr:hypothetical protein [Candidatus Saccharimonadales bacterium]
MNLRTLDLQLIALVRRWYIPLARLAIFIVYFWFGILKLFNLSPAGPLAAALTAKTIGLAHYSLAFHILAVYECVIGVMFLFPKLTRVVIPLLLIHIVIVCSPLLLVPHLAWQHPFVPTLEGQYIIKNVAIVALAIGLAAHTMPLQAKAKRR